MPFPGYFAARQQDPNLYARLRYGKDKGGRGVDFIYGFKKGGGSEIQSIRFNKSLFTSTQARKWLKDHGFSINLEAAFKEFIMQSESHSLSHEEIRDLIDMALREKYPMDPSEINDGSQFIIDKVWDDKVLLWKAYFSQETNGPKWVIVDYTVDEGSGDTPPSVILGELIPVTIQAVPKDGGEGIVLDEVGRRNASADAGKINQAIRTLLAILNKGDIEQETIRTLNARMLASIHGEGEIQDFGEAEWTQAFINNLPDSSFAYVRPGKRDETGRTVPRTNRFLPFRGDDGKTVDLPHLRNALARLPQTDLSNEEKAKAMRVLQAAAKRAGVGAGNKESTAYPENDIITEAWNLLPGETFTEAFSSALSEVEVDYDALVLKNVVVLGPLSANGRKYPVETQKRALSLFEGIRAYVNHPKLNEMREPRDMRDLIGEHKNLRIIGDKTVSDLYLIDNAVVRDVILPLAESKPHLAGNSIVARGKMVKEKDGTHKVEQILAARSIDIVTEPATTNSLFTEGKQIFLEEEEMDLRTLTVDVLEKERPDLFEAMTAKIQRGTEVQSLKDTVIALESKMTELRTDILERDKKIATYELETARIQKNSLIESLFKSAKIPNRVKYTEKDGVQVMNPHFHSLLERCQDESEMKELVKAWQETCRQGPLSEEKRLNFGENGNVNDEAVSQLYRVLS